MPTLNERLGEVVKRKRQRDRFTQADLGSRIGTSGSYISAIEAAKQDAYTFSASNRERDAFLSLYDSLSPEHQKQARNFLLFLREQQDHPPEAD